VLLKKRKKERLLSPRELNRINILLLSNSKKQVKDIADFLGVEKSTVLRTKVKYLKKGIEYALSEQPRSGQPRKYNQHHETVLVAFACSKAPKGRSRWTLNLLAKIMKEQEGLKTITRESIRVILKKTNVSLG
jgi:putative transposase